MLSRVADNLYWMSRYLERAELTARVLDVNLTQMLDQTPELEVRRWERVYAGLMIEDPGVPNEATATRLLTVDLDYFASVSWLVNAARDNARQIRELLSTEMWQQINELHHAVHNTTLAEIMQQPSRFLKDTVCSRIHLIRGIADTTVLHGEKWQYLEIGRFLERSLLTTTLLRVAYQADYGSHSMMEWVSLLRSCLSFHPYCATYTATFDPELIAEFLLLNHESPRSVRYAADQIHIAMGCIKESTGISSPALRYAGKLKALLNHASIDELMEETVPATCANIRKLCEQIDAALYATYINPKPV